MYLLGLTFRIIHKNMAHSITIYYNLKRKFYREHARVEQRSWVIITIKIIQNI